MEGIQTRLFEAPLNEKKQVLQMCVGETYVKTQWRRQKEQRCQRGIERKGDTYMKTEKAGTVRPF